MGADPSASEQAPCRPPPLAAASPQVRTRPMTLPIMWPIFAPRTSQYPCNPAFKLLSSPCAPRTAVKGGAR
jgi:hypothetical protein